MRQRLPESMEFLVTPYLGARIPVGTSYDNEFLAESRDTAFIFQLTYRPFKMVD